MPLDQPPRRGEVWWADIPGDKIRPVVVVHRTSAARFLHSLLVAPVFSRVRDIPTEVLLTPADGLPKICAANLDNLVLLDQTHLRRRQAHLSPQRMEQMCAALRFAVDC